jgi:hypothetical protein
MKRLYAMCLAAGLAARGFAAEPVSVVSADAVTPARQPQVAVTEEGLLFVAFGSGETVYCSVSRDQARTFEKPVVVAQLKGLALGKRRGPRIAARGSQVVITALSHQSGDVLSWRSLDEGKTWSGPATVNDAPKSAVEGLHAMAANRDGGLYCVWLDLRNKKTEIAGAASTDGGATWNKNQLVYHSPSGSVCECCHPSAAFDPAGRLFVMWRNSLEGNRDMYLTTSSDMGQTFSTAAKLGTGSWRLNACPMDGGWLAPSFDGGATTIWRRDREVFRTVAGRSDEQSLGSGEQPWAAAASGGAYLTWVSRRGGELWLLRPADRTPIKLAASASDPVLAAPPSGRGPIVAAWETGHGKDVAIMAQVLKSDSP